MTRGNAYGTIYLDPGWFLITAHLPEHRSAFIVLTANLPSPTSTPRQFALNLEYLEGNFYSCATHGKPLDKGLWGGENGRTLVAKVLGETEWTILVVKWYSTYLDLTGYAGYSCNVEMYKRFSNNELTLLDTGDLIGMHRID